MAKTDTMRLKLEQGNRPMDTFATQPTIKN